MHENTGEQRFPEKHSTEGTCKFLSRPKGVGFGQGAGALGMDTGEHLGNKSGSEIS